MIKTRAPQRDFEGMEMRRKRAAKLFAKGATQADVARELEVSRESVSRWHEAWSQGGASALKGAGRAGRRSLLDSADLAAVEKALRRGPRASGFATDIWTLPRISEVIATLTGVTLCPSSKCCRRLATLHYRQRYELPLVSANGQTPLTDSAWFDPRPRGD